MQVYLHAFLKIVLSFALSEFTTANAGGTQSNKKWLPLLADDAFMLIHCLLQPLHADDAFMLIHCLLQLLASMNTQ
jgi:hypothetical protein